MQRMKLDFKDEAGRGVSISLPATIQNVGANAQERRLLLLSIAKQAIEQRACVFYVSENYDESVWARIFSIAARAGRAKHCFAAELPDVTPILPAEVLACEGILWHPTRWVPGSDKALYAFLTSLALALEGKKACQQVVVILDGCASRAGSLPELLVSLAGQQNGDSTFIFSEQDARTLHPIVSGVSDCSIFMQVVGWGSEWAVAEQLGWSPLTSTPLPTLKQDEAIIRRQVAGGGQHFERISISPARFHLVKNLRPANHSAVA